MKKLIKILAIVLTLTMLVAVFAACKNEPPIDNSANSGSEGTPVTPDDPSEPNVSEDPNKNVIKISDMENFKILVQGLNENPEASKGKTYKLYADIVYVAGWDSSPTAAYGKLVAPGAIEEFPGIKEFYGTFDGNGYTISSIYRVGANDATVVGGFIDKLNGGTVKNLVFNNAYICDGNGATVGGLVGVVNGANAVIENVTVNSNVYAANDSAVTVGGVVGAVEADGFKMTNVTFGGKAGNIAADLTVPSASAAAKLAQLVGNAGDKAVTLTGCAANGDLICAEGATKEIYANGSAITASNCTTTPCANPGIVEISEYKIYTAEELLALAAYDSTYEGKTVKLMNNIDLNPEWIASAAAPENVWSGIADFKGVFDGNHKVLSGLYRTATDTASAGIIDTLNGGTVKNLIVLNSAVVYSSETTAASVGLIGTANGGVIDTVYSELDAYVTGTANANVGGMIGTATGATSMKKVVFNGDISADGKTVDQAIAVQSAEAVAEDILTVGTGSVSTEGRIRILTEKTTDIPEGYEWEMSGYIMAIMPVSVARMMKALSPIIPDITWYNDTDKVFTLTTPEQFVGFEQLAQSNTFEGITIKLGADIDLNPDWDATTTVGSNNAVTLASTPVNIWKPIPTFKGTIDGQKHTISGIYSYTDYTVPEGTRYLGGFINVLQGGTVTNLIVNNSIAYFTSTTGTSGTSRIRIGGFIGRVIDSTLENLYVDIDAWNDFNYHYTMGGMICEIDTAAEDDNYVGTIKDIVYAGTSGKISSDGTWSKNDATSKTYLAGMIAQNHNAIANSGDESQNNYCYVTMENVSFIGTWYRPEEGDTTGDPLLGFTGRGNYSSGIGINNMTMYCNAETTAGTIGAKANDIGNNKGATVTADDNYDATEWATITIANGAKVTDPILLPKTVVDMLTAANA